MTKQQTIKVYENEELLSGGTYAASIVKQPDDSFVAYVELHDEVIFEERCESEDEARDAISNYMIEID